MNTPVYIKLDAPEQLLLVEGVCRQLNIITYHPPVGEKSEKRGQTPIPVTKETGEIHKCMGTPTPEEDQQLSRAKEVTKSDKTKEQDRQEVPISDMHTSEDVL